MGLQIVLVNSNFKQEVADDLSTIKTELDEIPHQHGFTMEGGVRKFIVLVGSDPTTALLVIGPRLANPRLIMGYGHRHLLNWVREHYPDGEKYEVRGGGMIKFFSLSHEAARWSAEVYDSSGDFGVYHPIILTETAFISKQMGLPVRFRWEG